MKKSASAVWQGDLKTGRGFISTETGTLHDAPYGFNSRFGDGPGTNPEELIGAAHAGCFSMALSLMLGKENLVPDRIDTSAEVTLQEVEGGFEISAVHLVVKARVPGADAQTFGRIADKAKQECPVSRLLSLASISMDATLEGA